LIWFGLAGRWIVLVCFGLFWFDLFGLFGLVFGLVFGLLVWFVGLVCGLICFCFNKVVPSSACCKKTWVVI
jgi:hypothetical protein